MNATKTLAITRPEGMHLANRHFDFVSQTGQDLRTYEKPRIAHCINRLIKGNDGSMAIALSVAALSFCEDGAQLCVERALSADLEASSICGDLDSIVWPALALHVVFEDDTLPSFIAQKRTVVPGSGRYEEGFVLNLSLRDESYTGIVIGPSDWRALCDGKVDLSATPRNRYDKKSSAEETEVVRYMALLLAKVLAYASIPRFAPTKLLTRAEKKAAGIHPNQQVSAPTLLLRHLPRVIKDTDVTPTSGSIGDAHRFMGRAGHLRHYQAERYKAMKGQWQWIPPIPPPEGIKVIYKVRKVAT